MTPVKYERHILQVTSVLIILKNTKNNETEKIGSITPTPEVVCNIRPIVARFRPKLHVYGAVIPNLSQTLKW